MYEDTVMGDLILQNERLAADIKDKDKQLEQLAQQNKKMIEQLSRNEKIMEMAKNYYRSELLTMRNNLNTILHCTNNLITSNNVCISQLELNATLFEDDSKIDIGNFANMEPLPPLEEVTEEDFDCFN
jgi:hypothetical protein